MLLVAAALGCADTVWVEGCFFKAVLWSVVDAQLE